MGLITIDKTVITVGSSIMASGEFSDAGTDDIHNAEWDWGDENTPGTVIQGAGFGSVSNSHFFSETGIFTINLTVTDNDGDSDTESYKYVVVYDPNGGFLTGGGWINSPEGAFVSDPELTGKANFGFVSKYKRGKNVPTGNTEYVFHAGDLNIHSYSYDWLVITGSNYAKYKGRGTINGAGDYKFKIWAGDNDPDTFRIKIWEEDDLGNEIVVYDNTVIAGGSIVNHKGDK